MAGRTPEDPEREKRITMEIVVDTYGPEETAMGWYCYLEDKMTFPFTGTRRRKDPTSSRPPRKVTITGMADSDDCLHDMRVEIELDDDTIDDVALSKLDVLEADDATRQAVADWHYWVKRGYSF